jgi:hypothetical protein
MRIRNILFALSVATTFNSPARADEAIVTWADPSCGFFVVQLPDGDPADAYGLFSWETNPGPQLDDTIEGDNFVAGKDVTATNKRNSDKYKLIHWANAKSPEMLIRNTPVQCKSKWKKKK